MITLSQEQIEAIWEGVASETYAEIESKNPKEISKTRVEVKNTNDEIENIFFIDECGKEINEADYNE